MTDPVRTKDLALASPPNDAASVMIDEASGGTRRTTVGTLRDAKSLLTKTIPALPSVDSVLLYDHGGAAIAWTNNPPVGGYAVDLSGIADGDLLAFQAGSPSKIVKKTPSGGSIRLETWNETDATQFQLGLDQIGGGGCVLSKVSNNRGPRLRVAFPTKTTGNLATFVTWKSIDLRALTSLGSGRHRFAWEFDFVAFSGDGVTGTEWYAIGPAFMCNDVTSGFYGLSWGAQMAGGASRGVVCKNDTVTLSGDTPTWPQLFTDGDGVDRVQRFRCEVIAVKQAGAQPYFLVTLWLKQHGTNTAAIVDRVADSIWNSIASFSTNWNAVDPVTVGIMFLGSSGTTAAQYFEFANLHIDKHPMDC